MKKKSLLLRIVAGIVALGMITLMLTILNSFVGNPIASVIAKNKITEYVEQEYSFLDWEIGKVSYNFKFGTYSARVQSSRNIDEYFTVNVRGGKVRHDTYYSSIIGKDNTLRRLEGEYTAYVRAILQKEMDVVENRPSVSYSKEVYEDSKKNLTLGMPLSTTLPLKTELYIRYKSEDPSLSSAADVMQTAYKILTQKGCHFEKFSLYAELEGDFIMVNDITEAEINGADFMKVFQSKASSSHKE